MNAPPADSLIIQGNRGGFLRQTVKGVFSVPKKGLFHQKR
jgi:hypothetical protein